MSAGWLALIIAGAVLLVLVAYACLVAGSRDDDAAGRDEQ